MIRGDPPARLATGLRTRAGMMIDARVDDHIDRAGRGGVVVVDERDLVLGASALAALNAANALRPFDRRGKGALWSFVAGWPTSELPLAAIGTHAALNAAAIARGDLRGWRGALTGALSAASAGALVSTYRTARRAGEVYEDALVGTFGHGYRDEIVHSTFPGPDAPAARTPGVAGMTRIRHKFAHHHDISYGPAGGANLLDVWSRDDLPRDAKAPVLLQMPGGAWVMGNKQVQAYPLMSHLASRGWVCVAISYRLSPRNTWPAQIVDVKRAIAWVRKNIADYGGDPDFIALTGGSAGGHLSSLAALTPRAPQFQPGFEDADTSVAACVPFYGAYDWTNRDHVGGDALVPFLEKRVVKTTIAQDRARFDEASPMSRVHADAPPFLISHGTNDSLIPVEIGRLFAQRLHAVSRSPVVYAELPGAQHAFDLFGSPRANAAAEAVGRFLGITYGRHIRAASPAG